MLFQTSGTHRRGLKTFQRKQDEQDEMAGGRFIGLEGTVNVPEEEGDAK